MLKHVFLLFFLSTYISKELTAQVDSNRSEIEIMIIEYYGSLLENKVSSRLLTNYKGYKESPNEYWNFLDETFLNNWDFNATTRALIGNENYDALSRSQFIKLSNTLAITLVRYAFESLSFYGEQKLNVIDIKVDDQQTLAWLKINMQSPRLPDIHLDLLLKRTIHGRWKGVDFRFKGVTYVNLKKNTFRQDFEELEFAGLLRKLRKKNKSFFTGLCEGQANYVDPTRPPCL